MNEIGWQPDELAVKRSEIESKVADIIEDDSLKVIGELAGTENIDAEDAAAQRRARDDLRLDTTPAEQQAAEKQADVLTWVVVGIIVILAAGSLMLTSIPALLSGLF